MKIRLGRFKFKTVPGSCGTVDVQRRDGEDWVTVDNGTRRIVLDAMRLLRAQGFVDLNPFEATDDHR